jgi:hypothetical protein
MIRVRNVLGDDIFGLWHVKQIIVNKDGKRFYFTPGNESFATKEEAEIHALDRARHFVQRKLGLINADIVGEYGHSWQGEGVAPKSTNFVKRLERMCSRIPLRAMIFRR